MKCVILAGGSGDRLWPLSRRSYPKQFVEIKENRSFLQETVLRNMPFCDEFIVVTNEKYRFIVEGQLQVFQGLKYTCCYETESKGTMLPVILINMLQNPSELLLFTAADMAVSTGGYREDIIKALEMAKQDNITVLGIPVTSPSTRYGYIKHYENNVLKFIEKPDENEAALYWKDDSYLWNSGIFMTKCEVMLEEFKRVCPQFYKQCNSISRRLKQHFGEVFIEDEEVSSLPHISIEKALFEKIDSIKVTEATFEWKDMDTLTDVLPFTKHDNKNVIFNKCKNVDVVNRTKQQLVVADNISDIAVINTPDVVYVSSADECGKTMRKIMEDNIEAFGQYFEQGQLIYRPWGHYEVLSYEKGFKVKKVTVFPGKHIGFHRHEYRSEHWSIVSGCATITLNGVEKTFSTNESIYVEKGIEHQVLNASDENLIIVEVGIGDYITEKDNNLRDHNDLECERLTFESIVKLEPAYKDYLWGGIRLKEIYGKKCDYDIIAESWELSAHPDGPSVIADGRYKGMFFDDYIRMIGKSNLGWKADLYEEFPVLVKLIDAKNSLSIQVHPDDDYAMQNEGEYGKNEMWHIIDCEKDSFIYCGFRKKVSKQEILDAIDEGNLENLLNKYYVSPGDTIFIPAGTVHAIGAGILLCEVQQNSNSTYRIYDYGRINKDGQPRELHLEKALSVINTDKWSDDNIISAGGENIDGGMRQILVQCKYFEAVKYCVDDEMKIVMDDTSFAGIIILKGKAIIKSYDMQKDVVAGETYFLLAGKNSLSIYGKCSLIVVRI